MKREYETPELHIDRFLPESDICYRPDSNVDPDTPGGGWEEEGEEEIW